VPLVDHGDCVLVVIDVQEGFYGGSLPPVVEDAVFSPGEMHERGLARMSAEGVELNHCKGLAYEWARTLERSRAVLEDAELGEAPFRL
jgi:hypothetical protein